MGLESYATTIYYIECDGKDCLEDIDGSDDQGVVEDEAFRLGWEKIDDEWFCPNCQEKIK